jgi:nucleotide-binding universal stress UspA family protein
VFPIRTILHPTDYSELSRPAFELACSLARERDAELLICHVAPPPIIAAGEVVLEFPTGEAEQMTAQLKRVKPDDPQVQVSHLLLRGESAAEIVQLAAEVGADLIVMGTHGRSGLGRLLMGSVAEAVMRKAPCPVLTVRTPFPGTQPQRPAAAAVGQHPGR